MLTVEKFSQQLFWDVRPEAVDLSANKRWFIARVLEYGKLEDWKNLVSIYSRAEIIEVALSLRTLDAKTVAFLCVIGTISRESFRCFISRQLNQTPWNS